MDTLQLTDIEVRILGALIEKQALTPDTYPLTLNALLNACNQLSSRDPVMALDEATLNQGIRSLLEQKLINERRPAGGRVYKYEHRLPYAWMIQDARLAALAILMLRGPQTAAEIRNKAGRIYTFKTVEEVEIALNALADKYPPLAMEMEKQSGEREARWAHLLSGEPIIPPTKHEAIQANQSLQDRVSELEQTVESLSNQVAELKKILDDLLN